MQRGRGAWAGQSGVAAFFRYTTAGLVLLNSVAWAAPPADDSPVLDGTAGAKTDATDQPATARRASAGSETSGSNIVITATRSDTEAFTAPYTINSVKLNQFRTQRMVRSTPEALRDTPGVVVQKTSNGQGSPYLRGFTGFRTLMLVDGIRLNHSVMRDGPNQYWNTVDPYTIDRLEVVKGPSSVLYGSDSVGGTVNAVLRQPEGFGGGTSSYRQLFYRFSTAEHSNVGRGEVNAVIAGQWGVLVGGTVQEFGDVDGGRFVGPQRSTGYGVGSGDIKMVYRFSKNASLTFAHYAFYEDDASRQHKTFDGISWKGTTVGNEYRRVLDQGRTLTYVRYNHKNMGAFLDEMELTASYQTASETRYRLRSRDRTDHQGFDLYTYGLAAQFVSPSCIGKWTYGVEWYHDEVDSFKRTYQNGAFTGSAIQGPVGDDASYDLLGIYVQNQIPLCESVDLTLGGRYTYARAKAEEVEDPATGNEIKVEDDWQSLIGSARINWYLDRDRHWNAFGGVSQSFRAPNLSDLTRLDSARTDEIETPSPNLDPEEYITFETGVKAEYDTFTAQASYFYTDINDMIVRTPTGNIVDGDNEVTKQNAGDGHVQGVELEGRWRFHPQWTAFGQVAYTYGEITTFPTSAAIKREECLDRSMPVLGQVGLRWDHPNKKVWAEAVCSMASKADKLSTRDQGDTQRIPPGGTPGYVVFDLRAGWRPCDGLEVWGALENVTNRDYRYHGSGVNEPGINLKFGVRWRF